jgi:hypothetical protein
MDKADKQTLIAHLYPLVSVNAIKGLELAEVLGYESASTLRGAAFRLAVTGDVTTGLELKELLEESSLDPLQYVDLIYARVMAGRDPQEVIDHFFEEGWTDIPEDKIDELLEETDTPGYKLEERWCYKHNQDNHEEIDGVYTFIPDQDPVYRTVEQHREMRMDYSSWDGQPLTINQMARKWGLTAAQFKKYKAIHGWTHDLDGYLDIDIANADIDDLSDNLIQRKRRALEAAYFRKLEKADKEDAEKWRELQAGIVEPAKHLMSHIVIHEAPKLTLKKGKDAPVRKLIINASDWQLGEIAASRELLRGNDYNLDIGVAAISRYVQQIADYVERSGYTYDEAFICDLGDLGHGLEGYTAHGTQLEVGHVRQEQVDAIFNCLMGLIDSVRQIVPRTSVHHVQGNHLGFMSDMIFDQLAMCYGGKNPVEDTTFHHNYKTVQYVPVGDDVLLVMFHGKGGGTGAKALPPGKEAKERMLYNIVAPGIRQYPNHERVAVLSGHIHHRVVEEFTDFTAYTFGSTAQGDKYCDDLLLASMPTQSIMEMDPATGLIHHIPFLVEV